jgi:hypothetical protein
VSNTTQIYPLSVTSVVENEDGSLELNCSGQLTRLQGEDADAFKQATQRVAPPPYEQPMPGPTLLESVRAQHG